MGPIPPTDTVLAERCRSAGLKVTPQRLAIYRAILAATDHPSAEDLFTAVRQEQPSLSLGTIYKTLDAFEAAGLVCQVALLNESKRYDGNLQPHHHLICTVCRRIVDIVDPTFDALKAPKELRGFVADEVKVQILGRCVQCAKMTSPEENNG